jgi:uncharacterized membrane protein
MKTPYNRIAGQSAERLAALSDGVFAVALTLLVLDVKVPPGAPHGESAAWAALVVLAPRMLMALMSFLTLGIFWVGQQTGLNYLERSDRDVTWIHLAFLFAVSMLPFSTSLLAEHVPSRIALVAYWFNVLLLGSLLYWAWRYAVRRGLVRTDLPPEVAPAIERRILIAQALYAGATLLCVVSTWLSIALIVLLQLQYAVGLQVPRRR